MCCEGGILLFTLYDQRISSSLLFVVWLEILVVMGFYGINNFVNNVQEMGMKFDSGVLNKTLRIIIIISLGIVTPAVLIAVAVIGWLKRKPVSYGGENFPELVEDFGWLLELGPLILVPVMAIFNAYSLKNVRPLRNIWKGLIKPSLSWQAVNRDVGNDQGSIEEEAKMGQDNIAYSPSPERIESFRQIYDDL